MGFTALFGGTFNPPHIGHYEMLDALEKCSDIDEIWLMPDKIPPHKVCDFLACDEDRISMCRMLAEDFKKVRLCLIEFEREGKSYTIDTVQLLKKKYPEKSFAFVCGGDMLISFDKWHKYRELMTELPFICFVRAGASENEFEQKVKGFTEKGMSITVMPQKIVSVSSTQIRNSQEVKTLLPERIYSYIKDRGIYGENRV